MEWICNNTCIFKSNFMCPPALTKFETRSDNFGSNRHTPNPKTKPKMPKKNLSGDGTAAPIDAWWWLSHKGTTTSFLCISLFALLIRSAVSMFPYSGAGTPPKFGDFEAQRHWMEITTNLPATDWYRNGTHNDLTYWGLDYPPLTAYQSYIHGILLRFFNPESVSLFSSRGHESYIG